jgi:hypothetical protein
MTLDDLLNQPLNSVADDGFSDRVMGRVRAAERLRLCFTAACIAAGAVLAFLLLPLQVIAGDLNLAASQIVNSAAVSLAAGAIILTLSLERQFSRL